MMDNWFYMTHITFKGVLNDELGERLTSDLVILGFDTPVSFLIGETSNEILTKIQQTFSNYICRKINCNVRCILCSLNPPSYAKLAWFVQRLLIMSPISKPLVKQILLPTENSTPIQQNKSNSNIKRLKKKIPVSF